MCLVYSYIVDWVYHILHMSQMNNEGFLNLSNLEAAEVPEKPTFSHSVKIEQSAKGARVTVHVSADNFQDARMQSTELFIKVTEDLKIQGVPLAPIEAMKNGVKA
jgi:hypothetical protein